MDGAREHLLRESSPSSMMRVLRRIQHPFSAILFLGMSMTACWAHAACAQNLLDAVRFHPPRYSPEFSLKLPSLPKLTPELDAKPTVFAASAGQATAVPPQRDVTWRLLLPNFLSDQKNMWFSFPHQLGKGHHWIPTLTVIGLTAGLVYADQYDAPYFRHTQRYHELNNIFSKYNTDAMEVVGPAALYLVGLARGDAYAKKTALFAGEAAADSIMFYAVAQEATHRKRPIEIPPNGDFSDTFWEGHKGLLSNSFPSGHTTEAFAIATVFERRYRRHKWVPWLAYGVAGAIAFSRLTLQSHFPSDDFVGAAVGYAVGRYLVLRGQ